MVVLLAGFERDSAEATLPRRTLEWSTSFFYPPPVRGSAGVRGLRLRPRRLETRRELAAWTLSGESVVPLRRLRPPRDDPSRISIPPMLLSRSLADPTTQSENQSTIP